MRNRRRDLFAGICSFVLIGSAAIAGEPTVVDLGEVKMLDVRGARHALSTNDVRGTAFVFLSNECPISRQYIPELNRLASAAVEKKLAFYGVVSDSAATRADAVKFVDEFHVAFPVLFDSSRELAASLGPDHLPEAFVVDPHGKVQYRGRIDDVYADIDKRRAEPAHRDLLDGKRQTDRRAADRRRGLPV
jgi:thiol-disulfide isomerase/thioredoxin